MKTSGWNCTDFQTLSGGASSTAITNVATSFEADHLIQCQEFDWALIGLASTTLGGTSNTSTIKIFGTYSDTGDGQFTKETNNKYGPRILYNQELGTVSTASNPDEVGTLPEGIYPGQPSDCKLYKMDAFAGKASGDVSESGTQFELAVLARMAGYESLQATGTGSLGTSQAWTDYYLVDGTAGGLSYVAIPCGMFQYIQLQITNANAGADTMAGFFNLVKE